MKLHGTSSFSYFEFYLTPVRFYWFQNSNSGQACVPSWDCVELYVCPPVCLHVWCIAKYWRQPYFYSWCALPLPTSHYISLRLLWFYVLLYLRYIDSSSWTHFTLWVCVLQSGCSEQIMMEVFVQSGELVNIFVSYWICGAVKWPAKIPFAWV